jgi:hypothetical protein
MLRGKLMVMTADEHLELAKKHLARVQVAWDPPDWPDLALYGFYCLENAVMAAALHIGSATQKSHPAKANAAQQLAASHGLADVSGLLGLLNDARKAEAYGDVPRPPLDPEDLARVIETYVDSVEKLLAT